MRPGGARRDRRPANGFAAALRAISTARAHTVRAGRRGGKLAHRLRYLPLALASVGAVIVALAPHAAPLQPLPVARTLDGDPILLLHFAGLHTPGADSASKPRGASTLVVCATARCGHAAREAQANSPTLPARRPGAVSGRDTKRPRSTPAPARWYPPAR